MLHTLKKRRLPVMIVAGLLLAAVLLVILLPRGEGDVARAARSVQSDEARIGTLAATVTGTGNLTTESGQAVRIPTGLTVEEVFVASGDIVTMGDPLATFDIGSIQSRIAAIQEELDELDREIERVRANTEPTRITTRVAGRIEAVYAQVGDSVTDAMVEHGALAQLSIDGSDGGMLAVTGTSGRITQVHVRAGDRVGAGATLFTLIDVDESPAFRELIRDRADQAETLNTLLRLARTGELTASFDGIVERVSIGDGTAPPTGGSIPNLPGMPTMPGFPPGMMGMSSSTPGGESDLGIVRLGASEPMDLASSALIPPPPALSTGIVDLSDLVLAPPVLWQTPQLSVSGTGYSGLVQWGPLTPIFLPGIPYQAVIVLAVESDYYFDIFDPVNGILPWLVNNGIPAPGAILLDIQPGGWWSMAISVVFPPLAAPDIDWPDVDWPNISLPDFTWPEINLPDININLPGITLPDFDFNLPDFDFDFSFPDFDFDFSFPDFDFDFNMPDFDWPDFDFDFSFPDFDFSLPDFDFSMPAFNIPGLDMGGAAQNQHEMTAFTIAPAETMQLVVTIDERDILDLRVGQRAEVSLDAIEGTAFPGEISRINTTGTTGGGGARYAVEVTIPRTAQMLPGMSASAVITTAEVFDILLIPIEAIQEDGQRVFVYTALVSGEPANPVDVRTGLSDGLYVEILEGLSAGDVVYYIVLDAFRWPHWGVGPGWGPGGGGL